MIFYLFDNLLDRDFISKEPTPTLKMDVKEEKSSQTDLDLLIDSINMELQNSLGRDELTEVATLIQSMKASQIAELEKDPSVDNFMSILIEDYEKEPSVKKDLVLDQLKKTSDFHPLERTERAINLFARKEKQKPFKQEAKECLFDKDFAKFNTRDQLLIFFGRTRPEMRRKLSKWNAEAKDKVKEVETQNDSETKSS